MVYPTFEELEKNYENDRENMGFEEELCFINDCYDTYEAGGFCETFESLFDDNKSCNGMKFTVDGRVSYVTDDADLCALPMWHITLENGEHIDAYPEEICRMERE